MFRSLFLSIIVLSALLNGAYAQQKYDPLLRQRFVDSLRNVYPEISQQQVREEVRKYFTSLYRDREVSITSGGSMESTASGPASLTSTTTAFSYNSVADSIEYKALKALFLSTAGASWINKENWPYQNWPDADTVTWQDFAVWYGIDVENGDVNNLKLADNNLSGSLPDEMRYLTATDYLDFRNNNLIAIAPGIGSMSSLRTLYLTNNDLQSLPVDIGQLANLTYLLLDGNALTSLPPNIGALSSLRYLILSDNLITSLPDSIGALSSLEDLYVNNNKLTELPPSIGQLSTLTTLAVGSNQLKSLPTEIGDLASLQALRLSNNLFTALPTEFGQLSNLFSLYLEDNEFREFPREIFGLSNLNYLYLDNNQLTSLPDSISQLTNLSDLYLANNQFTVFPEEVYGLPYLLVLDLNGNQLTELPASIDTMQGLWDLFVNDNNLTALPAEVANMPLWSLRIGGNEISEIPSFIYQMSATLLDLDISRMGLTSLPSALTDSMYLEVLQVTGNKLDFGDLEPLFTAPGEAVFPYFDYSPQADIGVDTSLVLPVGSSLDYVFDIAGAHNRYYWEKQDALGNWILIDSATNGINRDFLTLSDEGLLRLRVTNEWVNGLTIYTRPVPVEVFYHNHVREETILVEGITDATQIDTLLVTSGEKATSWIYYDGLQRTVQAIGQQQSPGKHDGIQSMDYDALVRQNVSYLPFTSYAPDTSFYSRSLAPGSLRPKALTHEQPYFYKNPPPTIAGESAYPFTQTVFEDSPLGRPIKQGAPGTSWNVDNGRTVNYAYKSSGEDKVLHWRMMPDGTLLADSTYLAGQLKKTVVSDENGNVSVSYTDKAGKSILQKTQVAAETWLSTYVVYDRFSNVTFRIPPAAVAIAEAQTSYPKTLDADVISSYCFSYKYDNENRLIEEKAPGAESAYYVYDQWGRLRLSQTGNQRQAAQWTFSKYDALNRPVVSGFMTDSRSVDDIRSSFMSETQRYEHRDVSVDHGYGNQTLPTAYDEVLTVGYYDDYSFLEDQLPDTTYRYKALEGLPAEHYDLVQGMAVGVKTKILGTSEYLWSVSYFDQDLQMIQGVSGNHLGGLDRSAVVHDFSGRVIRTITIHFEGDTSRQTTITERPEYDHAGRTIASYHQINDQPEVQLSALKYNELGELIEKNLHVTDSGEMQSIDYRNNIRGWLTSMNNAGLTMSGNNDDEGDYFGMELGYDRDVTTGNPVPLHNGMISSVAWSNALDTVEQRAYKYAYDDSYRLLSATHYEKNSGWMQAERFTESQLYDDNGNITTLTRKDGQGADLDVLNYTYDGNRLMAVADSGNVAKGFKDGNVTGDDYAYDANGNLAKDRNLGIDTIYYYHSNQPDSLVFANGTSIKYVYDAAGIRLSQRVYNNTTLVHTRDYLGEFIYGDSTIEQIRHSEGRLTKSKIDAALWVYEYDLRDYLGNVRVTFTTEPYTETFLATMETSDASTEEIQFMKVADSRTATSAFIDHTGTSTSPKVTRLNGHYNLKEGPAKGLKVMPGDKVRMEVYVKYLDMRKADPTIAAATVLSMLTTGGVTRGPGDPGAAIPSSGQGGGGLAGLLGNTEEFEAPKAFLNYYLFDGLFNQLDAGFVQVSKSAAITQEHPAGPHEKLVMEVEIQQAGYLFTNLSHDSDENVEVYFDDYTITHEHGNIVQVQDYYPYGMPFNTKMAEHEVLNRYLYQGKELQDSTEWYDFHARQYSSALGRFLGVDPANQFASPFAAMGHNPVMGVDPDGRAWHILIGAVAGGIFNLATNWGNIEGDNFWEKLGSGASYFGVGMAGGAVAATGNFAAAGAIIGGANAALQGGNLEQVIMGAGIGAISGAIGGAAGGAVGRNLQGFVQGLVQGSVGGATGGFAGGLLYGTYQTGDIVQGLQAGLKGAVIGGVTGGLAGGVINGLRTAFPGKNSGQSPRNFWDGDEIASGRGRFSLNNTAKGNVLVGEVITSQNGVQMTSPEYARKLGWTERELKFSDGKLGQKFGKHMNEFPEPITHKQYVNLAKRIYSSSNSTVIKFPSNYNGLYPGEVHIMQGGYLLRIDAQGYFRSLYPIK